MELDDPDTAERWLAYLHVALAVAATLLAIPGVLYMREPSREWVALVLSIAIPGAWATVGIRVLRRRYGWSSAPALGFSFSSLLFTLGFVALGSVGGEPLAILILFAFGFSGMAWSYRTRYR